MPEEQARSERLASQIRFALEIDKLTGVLRQTLLLDRSRQENSAEHSWHVALMALLLKEYADPGVEISRVIMMLLVHDLVEIDAGDTYCYDVKANASKADRERCAADRIFGILPPDQGSAFRALWEEFEAGESADARFANAMDRLQPMLHNYHTEGLQWRKHGVSSERVLERNSRIADGSSVLWEYAHRLVGDAVARGYLDR